MFEIVTQLAPQIKITISLHSKVEHALVYLFGFLVDAFFLPRRLTK